MSWIKTISYEAATGKLKKVYDRVKGPDGKVDNILLSHSLRPHSLEGHMALYKYVLHHSANSLPKWLLEAVGVYVSMLNKCPYCVEHHFVGLSRLLDDDDQAAVMRAALEAGNPAAASAEFSPRDIAALNYAATLTRQPSAITESDIEGLRQAGLDDGEILEVNQVTAYFCYANRTVLGLGVTLEESQIGLSPNDSDDPSNWGHS